MEDNVALPKSIGIKLFDDSFVPVLSEGEIKNKKVILTTVKDNQKKAIIELYEGNSDRCVNNEYLGKLVISIDRQTNKGEPGIEVHLRLDENGMLYAKAWDVESGQETAIKIEHSKSKRIFRETLSDNEIDGLGGTGTKRIDNYESEDIISNYGDEKKSVFPIIRGILIALIILIILALLGLGGYYLVKNISTLMGLFDKPKTTTTTTTTTIVEETTTTTEEIVTTTTVAPKLDENITGIKKLEGKKHYIRRGDNLWNICKKYYNDPWYYPSLAKENSIKNPRLILAGRSLIIPPKSDLRRWDLKSNRLED
ncbi:MAG TPA: Hsp70 family protein [Spirochaetota bacterium]|nr:Hsp70 family protein [Spirochaetota bacterium]HOS31991.1 Hsp70 family protein [Spirochaetota bacterium]HOS55239.1 Hsp70 family protein [Spirochaetota bacterium]HPK61144.1 Hsp70 family protein [Spirochaetota bacterium]HQF77758.1 Hsp70 family protein [Spirochaetota bacterium]